MKPTIFALSALLLFVFTPTNLGAQTDDSSLGRELSLEKNFRSGYYFYNRRDYSAAISFFDQAIATNPHDHRSRIWLGQSFFMAGFQRNALTEWQVALNLGAGGNLLRNKLKALYSTESQEDPYLTSNPWIFLQAYEGYRNKKSYFIRPTGIGIDANRNLYVTGFANGKVTIMDPNGNIVNELSAGLSKPYGISFAPDGSFYVSDFGNDSIVRYSSDGKKLAIIGRFGYRQSELAGPEGVFVDSSGAVFVADSGNNRIQKFDPQGKFIMAFGKKGRGEGEFIRPADVLSLNDGKILVSDCGNKRLQVFDESGNFLKIIGLKELSSPRGLVSLDENRIAIADSRNGVVIHNLQDGSWNRLETLAGRVEDALGLAVDNNRILYITDFGNYRVSSFIPEQLKYVNLDVRLVRTLEHEFPKIQHTVLVRDREGRTITGLTPENFKVIERGLEIESLNLEGSWLEKDRLSLIFVIEKSLQMEEQSENLERVMRGILERLPAKDQIEVINAGETAWISQKFIANVLSPLAGARGGEFVKNPAMGKALYLSISESLAVKSRPVVIIMTAGGIQAHDWKPWGIDTCQDYAANNGVPIYAVVFGQGRIDKQLEEITASTGGKIFDGLRSSEIYSIRDQVLKSPLRFYQIGYKTTAHPKLRNTYRELSVEVKYSGLFGYDSSGYYIP